jgi:hypothetical protein
MKMVTRLPKAAMENQNLDAENKIGKQIIDAAILIHRTFGPDLLESAYQEVLTYKLRKRGLQTWLSSKLECRITETGDQTNGILGYWQSFFVVVFVPFFSLWFISSPR